jgi:hypothetical protein
VPVRRRLGHVGRRDGAAGTGAVLDDHVLAEQLLQLLAQLARQHIGRAAGRERRDERDHLARERLGLGTRRLRRGDGSEAERGGERRADERATKGRTESGHGTHVRGQSLMQMLRSSV